MDVRGLLQNGRYVQVLTHSDSRPVLENFVNSTFNNATVEESAQALNVGLAALSAFLQVNVTGPALESAGQVQHLFAQLEKSAGASASARKTYLASLDVDGVSVYPHTPQIELFCLARWVFSSCLSGSLPSRTASPDGKEADDTDPAESSLPWLRLRIHSWHYKLLTEPNPGPGSVFNKMTQWSDLPTLQEQIQLCLDDTEKQLSDTAAWTETARVQFLVEQTNVFAMLGLDTKAKSALAEAAKLSRFEYVLSGALGKRTKFQDKSTSQLIILAKSAQDTDALGATDQAADSVDTLEKAVPQALALNNDTLLEKIDFSDASGAQDASIPASLRGLTPNNQPQLSPLDQIILLSEATLKDAFSPADSLTLEEILPFATRVLSDKSTNWQVYSQALIVRSRIELHRSRTVERGVLQMQAMVDQVVVDTTAPEPTKSTEPAPASVETETTQDSSIPSIEFTGPDAPETNEPETPVDKPSTFFPAAEAGEQAPPQVRLRYVHALSTPPRWHLESELAFAWAGVGSLISALEIFKRLRLWAEVALCLASSASADDEGGRGSGGEEKARGLIRWQIFQATDPSLEPKGEDDGKTLDVLSLKPADFQGAERDPPPPNVPRLFCILGDIETEPKYYERAWELSKGRYSRAQRSLGEHYLQKQEWEKALEAYKKAVAANRLNPQLWGRLGDINLRLGLFSEAAEAFSRALGAANDASGGEDARTWSNLGSALYSLYLEVVKKEKEEETRRKEDGGDVPKPVQKAERAEDEEDDGELQPERPADLGKKNPGTLLAQSLAAYKRGATISHDNWRIWDNVVTLASRVRPPVVSDIILAMRNILLVRNTEDAIDVNVVRLLLNETVLVKPKPADGVPARGTQEKAVCDLIENILVPLITKRSELWEVVARERVWRSDYGGAIDAAEKGWRAAIGGAGSGTLGSTLSVSSSKAGGLSDEEKRNWLENADAWDDVVARTDELVSILENYGADAPTVGTRWKMKARSALRSVMGKGKESWEGSAGWTTLENLLEGLK
ncbi:tpr repeat-containing protein [Ophiostoma piceae UAMH 11346]|uniref:Tpr repeat-containing protein n=1 Tax=Ophiostoma piceae (strain UAMH 11346) TaxID=1262450 RepID=S3C0L0_OPHP1|nr:tpr repeat-containing protein [Ophiostoma piceae UAMH 11346]